MVRPTIGILGTIATHLVGMVQGALCILGWLLYKFGLTEVLEHLDGACVWCIGGALFGWFVAWVIVRKTNQAIEYENWADYYRERGEPVPYIDDWQIGMHPEEKGWYM